MKYSVSCFTVKKKKRVEWVRIRIDKKQLIFWATIKWPCINSTFATTIDNHLTENTVYT